VPRTATSDVTAKLLGQAIRRARMEAGLTQSAVAERMGTSHPYVANLEAGRGNPTVGQLANIASALGAALDIDFRIAPRETVIAPDRDREPLTLANDSR
jgi:transcriptional regulator with XRE-family HTH domain